MKAILQGTMMYNRCKRYGYGSIMTLANVKITTAAWNCWRTPADPLLVRSIKLNSIFRSSGTIMGRDGDVVVHRELSSLSKQAPPLLMYQTFSPNVYIASSAVDNYNNTLEANRSNADISDDESNENDAPLHPKQLFCDETVQPPPIFKSCSFDYVHPKDFKYELQNNNVDDYDEFDENGDMVSDMERRRPKKQAQLPEVAFIGLSNVGKSSLINAITQRKDLARVSKRPGRTQQVNYFGLFPKGGKKNKSEPKQPIAYLIDLPGYGYASAPDEMVEQWQKTTQDFLMARNENGTLKRLYILLDSRRSNLTLFDQRIFSWFEEAGIPYMVVLTKSDTARKSDVIKQVNQVCMRYLEKSNAATDLESSEDVYLSPYVHVTSSKKREGIIELLWTITNDFESESNDHSLM